jgi:hypothetical protein
MSNSKSGAVIHRQVAVIACDNASTLKETLVRLAGLQIDAVCLGERHLVLPAEQVKGVLACLNNFGQFPRLIGEESAIGALAPPPEADDDAAPSDAVSAAAEGV